MLSTLGIGQTHSDEAFAEWDDFSLAAATEESPVTRCLHIGFAAPTRAHVDEFWRAGTGAGYRDDGAPGPRPSTPRTTTARSCSTRTGTAPRGCTTSRCARAVRSITCGCGSRTSLPRPGSTTRSLPRPDCGRATTRRSALSSAASAGRSHSWGDRTEHVHIFFGVTRDESVDTFHAAAVAGGYADNGRPGERPEYHSGYYSAYVLDPDGNNIELVNHNRAPG